MQARFSLAAGLALLALWGGGQACAAVGLGSAGTPAAGTSLSDPAVFPGGVQGFAEQQAPLERLLLGARIASVGNLNVVESIDPIDLGGGQPSASYTGLFRSITLANSPYSLLTNGGHYFGSAIALGEDLHAHLGAFSVDPQRLSFGAPNFSYLNQVESQQSLDELGSSQSGFAGVDWDFASWGTFGVVATQTSEQNGLLGGFDAGAVGVAKSTKMSTVGMTARVGLGNGWVTTLSYNEGLTQLALKPNTSGTLPDALHSRAYGFAVAKRGLFDENDSLGLALTRPLQVYSGGADFAANGFDTNLSDLKFNRQSGSPINSTPETDFEVGYVTTFMGGTVALQANAGYQMNVDGFGGTNSLSVVSRAKINF